MVKVRLQGLPAEVREVADALQRAGVVLERSAEYVNRGGSRYVRVYLECALREARPAKAIAIEGEEG